MTGASIILLVTGLILVAVGAYAYGFEMARSGPRTWIWMIVSSCGATTVVFAAYARGSGQ